jgi:hypothetical protein
MILVIASLSMKMRRIVVSDKPGPCVSYAEVFDTFQAKEFVHFYNAIGPKNKDKCTKKQLLGYMAENGVTITAVLNALPDDDKLSLKLEKGFTEAMWSVPRQPASFWAEKYPHQEDPTMRPLGAVAKEPTRRTKRQNRREVITLLAEENPKRNGSKSWYRFAAYVTGMTVEEAIHKGLTSGDIKYDQEHGYISLSK